MIFQGFPGFPGSVRTLCRKIPENSNFYLKKTTTNKQTGQTVKNRKTGKSLKSRKKWENRPFRNHAFLLSSKCGNIARLATQYPIKVIKQSKRKKEKENHTFFLNSFSVDQIDVFSELL